MVRLRVVCDVRLFRVLYFYFIFLYVKKNKQKNLHFLKTTHYTRINVCQFEENLIIRSHFLSTEEFSKPVET